MIIHYIRRQIQNAFDHVPVTTILGPLLLCGLAFYSSNLFDGIYQKDVSSSRQTLGKGGKRMTVFDQYGQTPMDLSPTATVGDLRAAYAKRMNVPPQALVIAFANFALNDDAAALPDVGVTDQACVTFFVSPVTKSMLMDAGTREWLVGREVCWRTEAKDWIYGKCDGVSHGKTPKIWVGTEPIYFGSGDDGEYAYITDSDGNGEELVEMKVSVERAGERGHGDGGEGKAELRQKHLRDIEEQRAAEVAKEEENRRRRGPENLHGVSADEEAGLTKKRMAQQKRH